MPAITHAQTLSIEGPDAPAFAHAQFSSDVQSLAVGRWQFGAWLNAQGRVRVLFQLARLDEQRLLLLLRGGDASALGAVLQRYVLRARLTLQPSPWRVLAADEPSPLHVVQREPHAIVLGCGTHGLRLATYGAGDQAWRRPQLELGWPWLPDAALETLLPPALSLHRLQAVALDKGCYPGQEIVARLHWRGGHKRHLCRVRLSRDATPGDCLRLHGNEIGVLLEVVANESGSDALAVLNDELASSPDAGTALSLDDELSLRLMQRWES